MVSLELAPRAAACRRGQRATMPKNRAPPRPDAVVAMTAMSSEALLEPISPDAPCGANLEYDPEFTALERAASPPSEARIVGADSDDDGPDWVAVARQAIALLSRTKDLRIVSILIKALLRTNGLVGLSQGVFVLRSLIERYWDTLYPELLEDEDNDPALRINAMQELCDRRSMLVPLRAQPLVSLSGLGSFSLKDVALATGEAQPGKGDTVPDMATIDAAFANCELTQLTASAAALDQAISDLRTIETTVTTQLGVEAPLSFDELTRVLLQMHKVLQARLDARQLQEPRAWGNGGAASEEPSAKGAASEPKAVALGEVSSREDVQRVLDKLCAYYQKHEPSSPVPLLLQRARRLAAMDFMEIIRDLAPSSLSEIETIRGPEDTNA